MNERKVELTGGTWALCFWLFLIAFELGRIGWKLQLIVEALQHLGGAR